MSSGTQMPTFFYLSVLLSSTGWFVLLGWHLLGPTWLPHLQELQSNNIQRKKGVVSLSLSHFRNKEMFPKASGRLFWTSIGLESMMCPFLNNHWQEWWHHHCLYFRKSRLSPGIPQGMSSPGPTEIWTKSGSLSKEWGKWLGRQLNNVWHTLFMDICQKEHVLFYGCLQYAPFCCSQLHHQDPCIQSPW